MGYLDEYVSTIMACRFCPMCRHVCTVANAAHLESTSPRGWALTCYALAVGIFSPEDVAQSERLFQCAACDLCYEDCVSKFQPSRAFKAARADLVDLGLSPPVVQGIANSVARWKNPFGQNEEKRKDWSESLSLPQQGDILFFGGCEIIYKRPEITQAFLKICAAAQIEPAILPHENCCGAPLHNLGYWSEARELAHQNIEAMKAGNCKTVVFGCPTCQRQVTQTYREEYQLDLPSGIEILHTSQFVERLLNSQQLKLSRALSEIITYHDPCSLGRAGLAIYDTPRYVLAECGLDLVEMEWSREQARCCGSATLHQTYPSIAGAAAQNTFIEFERTGSNTLVTACPACKSAFLPQVRQNNTKVLDLLELVAQAL